MVDTLADREAAFIFETWVGYQVLWIRNMKLVTEILTTFFYFFLIVMDFKFDPQVFFLLRYKDPEDLVIFFSIGHWPALISVRHLHLPLHHLLGIGFKKKNFTYGIDLFSIEVFSILQVVRYILMSVLGLLMPLSSQDNDSWTLRLYQIPPNLKQNILLPSEIIYLLL